MQTSHEDFHDVEEGGGYCTYRVLPCSRVEVWIRAQGVELLFEKVQDGLGKTNTVMRGRGTGF